MNCVGVEIGLHLCKDDLAAAAAGCIYCLEITHHHKLPFQKGVLETAGRWGRLECVVWLDARIKNPKMGLFDIIKHDQLECLIYWCECKLMVGQMDIRLMMMIFHLKEVVGHIGSIRCMKYLFDVFPGDINRTVSRCIPNNTIPNSVIPDDTITKLKYLYDVDCTKDDEQKGYGLFLSIEYGKLEIVRYIINSDIHMYDCDIRNQITKFCREKCVDNNTRTFVLLALKHTLEDDLAFHSILSDKFDTHGNVIWDIGSRVISYE
jgi:hypothetical protein